MAVTPGPSRTKSRGRLYRPSTRGLLKDELTGLVQVGQMTLVEASFPFRQFASCTSGQLQPGKPATTPGGLDGRKRESESKGDDGRAVGRRGDSNDELQRNGQLIQLKPVEPGWQNSRLCGASKPDGQVHKGKS